MDSPSTYPTEIVQKLRSTPRFGGLFLEIDSADSGEVSYAALLQYFGLSSHASAGTASFGQGDASRGLKRQDLRRIFDAVDTDHSGSLDFEELCTCFERLGMNESKASMARLMNEIDTDGNGTIEFEEFAAAFERAELGRDERLRVIANVARKLTLSEAEIASLRDMFDTYDTNRSGDLDQDELTEVLKALGLYESPRATVQLMESIDTDGTSKLLSLMVVWWKRI